MVEQLAFNQLAVGPIPTVPILQEKTMESDRRIIELYDAYIEYIESVKKCIPHIYAKFEDQIEEIRRDGRVSMSDNMSDEAIAVMTLDLKNKLGSADINGARDVVKAIQGIIKRRSNLLEKIRLIRDAIRAEVESLEE